MAVEANKQNDEAAIQGLLDDAIRSLRDRNIEGIMALYTQEVISFDIVPPLRYVGADAFRKPWKEVCSSFQGPIGYEMHDLDITVGDDVAFTHSLNRIAGVPFPLFTAAVTCLSASAGWYLARSGDGAASRTAKYFPFGSVFASGNAESLKGGNDDDKAKRHIFPHDGSRRCHWHGWMLSGGGPARKRGLDHGPDAPSFAER